MELQGQSIVKSSINMKSVNLRTLNFDLLIPPSFAHTAHKSIRAFSRKIENHNRISIEFFDET